MFDRFATDDMITYNTRIQRFAKQGEKTGWTYIEISTRQAQQLNPGTKVSFRVKGRLDQHPIEKQALLPMGDGAFIMPLNAKIRKAIGKSVGDKLAVHLEVDERKLALSADLLKCLKDDAAAWKHFKTLSPSHQLYFSKWIEEAKTVQTKTKRLVMAVTALSQGQGYPEMIRANKSPRS